MKAKFYIDRGEDKIPFYINTENGIVVNVNFNFIDAEDKKFGEVLHNRFKGVAIEFVKKATMHNVKSKDLLDIKRAMLGSRNRMNAMKLGILKEEQDYFNFLQIQLKEHKEHLKEINFV